MNPSIYESFLGIVSALRATLTEDEAYPFSAEMSNDQRFIELDSNAILAAMADPGYIIWGETLNEEGGDINGV